MATAFGIGAFVVLLLFAIFFHEFGHYITARWAKIKVSKFFIGFGPTIWSTRRGRPETVTGPDGAPLTRPETEYGIKAFPIGGFVRVVGMSPYEEVSEEDQARSFGAAPTWKRAVVLGAGSVTHMVSAFVFLLIIFSAVGLPDPSKRTRVIDAVELERDGEATPAAKAKLRPGDEILEIDGRRIPSGQEMVRVLRSSPGEELVVRVRGKDGGFRTVEMTPYVVEEDGEKIGRIGIIPRSEITRLNPIAATGQSARVMGELFRGFVQQAPRAFSPSTLGLSGDGPSDERPFSIIGAGRLAADLAVEGQIAMFLFLFVQINIFVGVFNMFPLPPLDGGHLLVLLIEKVRRKPVDQRALVPVMAVVLSILALLALLLVYYDIVSPVRLPGR
ncbi:MAG TPA: M50 family metallopeptidase [Actinomycetota bacterium]|jgi:membrane-associated protease RseP (regulator of RpoE activity)|nr:M50 family metallopeptidase [Actinomycetota bacterium]